MASLIKFLNENCMSLLDIIFENRIVNFGKANPNYNQCVILAGGAASGKGTIQAKIDINGKVFDVDEFKQMYKKLQKNGKIDDTREYDLANPTDTSDLHQKVKDKGWKNKDRKNFFKHQDETNNKDMHMANVIFDMVSGEIEDVEEAASMAKNVGYTVTVVWVVTNVETAKLNNAFRGIGPKNKRRSVPDKILVKGHTDAYNTMVSLFTNKHPEVSDLIDFAWIGFGTGFGHKLNDEFEKSPVRKIKKDNNGNWVFDKKLVDSYLSKEQPINYSDGKYSLDSIIKSANEFDGDKSNNYDLLKLKKAAEMNDEIRKYVAKKLN